MTVSSRTFRIVRIIAWLFSFVLWIACFYGVLIPSFNNGHSVFVFFTFPLNYFTLLASILLISLWAVRLLRKPFGYVKGNIWIFIFFGVTFIITFLSLVTAAFFYYAFS